MFSAKTRITHLSSALSHLLIKYFFNAKLDKSFVKFFPKMFASEMRLKFLAAQLKRGKNFSARRRSGWHICESALTSSSPTPLTPTACVTTESDPNRIAHCIRILGLPDFYVVN